jgi:hypothetical protein
MISSDLKDELSLQASGLHDCAHCFKQVALVANIIPFAVVVFLLCAVPRFASYIVCFPGFGGPQCAQACGGFGADASYGPAGRGIGTPCIPCAQSGKTYGFSFHYNTGNDVYVPRTIARTGASLALDCLSEYSQLVDGSWFIPVDPDAPSTTVTRDVNTFAECVALCPAGSNCQFVTYDYVAKTCSARNAAEVIYDGWAFHQVAS